VGYERLKGGSETEHPMRTLGLVAALSLILPHAAFAQHQQGKECTFDTCKAGTTALTHFEKSDPFYTCPTRELANYVATLIGLMAMQATLTGEMPNISDNTGEPEYTGETKALVDAAREKAQVQSFDAAVRICKVGSDKRRVTVLNMPENSMAAYVLDDARKLTFWMPFVYLDKVR
jgi:hypothetical protein